MNTFYSLLKNRRSTRKFSTQTIENDKIETLKSTVLMSPTGKNAKEWEFILVDDKDILASLAKSKEHGSELIAKAPLAIVVLGDTTKSDVWIEDCSIASIILQLQAEELGLGSCWVQIRQRKQKNGTLAEDSVRGLLDIPSHYAVVSIVAIGYKDESKKPKDESTLQREKIHMNKFQ